MNTMTRVLVEHALPHRVRLRAPVISHHREACAHLAKALAASDAFAKITVRPMTGSVIVEDDARALDARDLARRIDDLVRTERDEQGRLLTEIPAAEHPGPTRVARAVAHAVAELNADLRAALDDHADLGTLLPVFFAIAGLTEAAKKQKLPVPTWFNLLWWSLRSFMTFNIRAVEDEVMNGKDHPPHDFTRTM